MSILLINEKKEKGFTEALELLKQNGFEISDCDPLSIFYENEAFHRINYIALDDDDKKIFNSLSEEQQDEIIADIQQSYMLSDIVLNYDNMDDIVRDVFEKYLLDNKIQK